MPRNTSVTLGDHFEAFVSEKIAGGRFQSVTEASSLVEDFSPREFLAEMRAKYGR